MPEPENSPRLFLSYTRKDSAIVKELYQKLKQAGYHPWMDIEDILPGQDWEQVMIQAINNAMFFLACLSTNSIDHRGVVQEEIKQALQVWRRKLDDDIYFIPVRVNECKVPDALSKFNWVDVFQEHGFGRLLAAILNYWHMPQKESRFCCITRGKDLPPKIAGSALEASQ